MDEELIAPARCSMKVLQIHLARRTRNATKLVHPLSPPSQRPGVEEGVTGCVSPTIEPESSIIYNRSRALTTTPRQKTLMSCF